MNCENELNFLCDILKKCHIRTALLSLQDTADRLVDSWFSAIISATPGSGVPIQRIVGTVENNTRYKFTSEFKLQYFFFRLPISNEKNLLFIGPFLSLPLSAQEILEIGERLELNANTQKLLKEYYDSLPIVSDGDRLFAMMDGFCERIWQTASFSISEINGKDTLTIPAMDGISQADDLDEILVNMERMEQRYAFENELMLAVTLGQQQKEELLSSIFNDQLFEKRISDPVRNAKNYCIIMNTLLRKAAEKGGVHPLYIDRVSSKFAMKIEMTTGIKSIPELMREMFSSYCRLVIKHSTKKFSPIVKKTILMIQSDISAELSLHSLAEKQGISTGYLATVFKKETGKTLSEYIREKRISHAVHLLNTTNLQIQTIAMHCGIMDIQYFSKIFKKQVGKTPKEYRQSIRP